MRSQGPGLQETARAAREEHQCRVRHCGAIHARHLLTVLILACVVVAGARSYAQDITPARLAPARASASDADSRLPFGAPARITIRYFAEDAAARQRAVDLARGLGEQGLDVADPVASPGRIASSIVSYFYAEDRPGAEIAARVLGPTWKLVQQRPSTRESFPRPGALELAIAGP